MVGLAGMIGRQAVRARNHGGGSSARQPFGIAELRCAAGIEQQMNSASAIFARVLHEPDLGADRHSYAEPVNMRGSKVNWGAVVPICLPVAVVVGQVGLAVNPAQTTRLRPEISDVVAFVAGIARRRSDNDSCAELGQARQPAFVRADRFAPALFIALRRRAEPGGKAHFRQQKELAPICGDMRSEPLPFAFEALGVDLRDCGFQAQNPGSSQFTLLAELRLIQFGIQAGPRQKLDMAAAFHDATAVHDQDRVGGENCAEPMSDDNAGASAHDMA